MKGYASSEVARAMRGIEAAVPRAKVDPIRPIYHFHPPAQWMNDPNGTIYHGGYYHVFYQHNPYADHWGHMHWGHARSKDLVYWEHLPIALWPSKKMGEEHCFSGCTVINGKGQPMIFYTSIGLKKRPQDSAEQWTALGDSELITWRRHPANPILTSELHESLTVYHWRDPFLFREQGRTFMVLGGKLSQMDDGYAVVALYEAEDEELTRWKYRGILFQHSDKRLRSLECPNFFKLGDKWALLVSPYGPVECFIGRFDLETLIFTSESQGVVDHSTNFYATNVLFDQKRRCILFGWVRGFKEGRGWNGCLSLPRVLSIRADGQLVQKPALELQKIRGRHWGMADLFLANTSYALKDVRGNTLEILAEFEPGDAKVFGLRMRYLHGSDVTISWNEGILKVADVSFPLRLFNGERGIKLHVFVDRSVLEVYVNECEAATRVIDPGLNCQYMEVFANEGSMRVKTIEVWKMRSIIR